MKPEEVFQEAQDAFDSIASKDIGAVTKSWLEGLEAQVRVDPIRALLMGAAIGAGLTALRGDHLRQASYRFAKIMALKALAGIDPQKHEIGG